MSAKRTIIGALTVIIALLTIFALLTYGSSIGQYLNPAAVFAAVAVAVAGIVWFKKSIK